MSMYVCILKEGCFHLTAQAAVGPIAVTPFGTQPAVCFPFVREPVVSQRYGITQTHPYDSRIPNGR